MTCTGCGRAAASLTPCEGERYCWPCTQGYLEEAAGNFRAAHYGERYRHARGHELPITPRAYRYR
jgi:hypothetical protein